jgi:hypothetical protein
VRTLRNGTKVFAGQREDPFFVDLGATFDGINLRQLTGNQGQGKDDLSGYNVHSVVMQVPERLVTRNGKAVSGPNAHNAVVGVWSTTERRRLQVTGAARGRDRGGWVQVSRLGNPLVNEVVVPLGVKDHFNATPPAGDAEFLPAVTDPELPKLITAAARPAVVPPPSAAASRPLISDCADSMLPASWAAMRRARVAYDTPGSGEVAA